MARFRDPHHLTIRAGRVVRMQLFKDIYAGGLGGALGIEEAPAEVPSSTTIIGVNRQDALRNGAVPIRLGYLHTSRIRRSATVLCSPEKADTIFTAGLSQQYKGKNIVSVLPARRRVFTV